ncbi:MAG: short-chain dehydrogenase [Rhodospirillaceae bacterium]|nr:MAG: short-chain dehydrogenase [Rhodospirillaceae bacterium]
MITTAAQETLNIIVTGGGRGLGFEMAQALMEAGHRVLITGARAGDELQSAANDLQRLACPQRSAHGVQALAMQADVANWDDCQRVAQACIDHWGRIDGLVNNAGRGMREISEIFNVEPALFWRADPRGFKNIIDANVMGPFMMARACVPGMVAQGFGRVVNISTSTVTMVRTGYSPYGPSKSALEAMSAVWAKDLYGSGVTCNVLLPGGATDTKLLPGDGSSRRGADGQLLSPILMRRPIVWLMSNQAQITGARYIAKNWPDDLEGQAAAEQARTPANALPGIM